MKSPNRTTATKDEEEFAAKDNSALKAFVLSSSNLIHVMCSHLIKFPYSKTIVILLSTDVMKGLKLTLVLVGMYSLPVHRILS